MKPIFIVGAGSFGTALAVMAATYCEADVTLWSHSAQRALELERDRENKKLLPGAMFPQGITVTDSLEGLTAACLAVIAVPSSVVRETAKKMTAFLPPDIPVVCVSKGLEAGSYKTLTQVIEEELPSNPVVALSGPSHAEEIARGIPTTVVSASRDRGAAQLVQDLLMNETLRIYVSDDILGVEFGAALKNVIALAAGILDGTKIGGDNTKAALITRGITEIARLGVVLGAKSETFAGLSGMGDLIVTCSSMHSRNRRYGILIGEGVTPEDAIQRIGMTVEGYASTKNAYELAQKHGIYMPMTDRVYQVLYQGKHPEQMVKELMALPKRHESETIWLLTK